MTKYLIFTLVIIVLILPFCAQAFLNGPIVPCGQKEDNPNTPDIHEDRDCTLCDIFLLIQNILNFLWELILVIAPVFVLAGGIVILTAGPKPEQVSLGKRIITSAIIGVVIALLAWTLINMLFNALVSESEGFPWPWNKIDCEGGGVTENKYCCCDLDNGDYTCSTYNSESECHSDCEVHCSGFPGYLRNCCVDTQRACSTAENRCNQMSPAGLCLNNNYSCQAGVSEQISDAAPELRSLLNCMAPRLPSTDAREISSISDNSGGRCFNDWNGKCSSTADSCAGTCCGHSQYSLHYGGKNCRGTSYAVDFAKESFFNYIHNAAKTCATDLNLGKVDVVYEGNHVHVELDELARNRGCL